MRLRRLRYSGLTILYWLGRREGNFGWLGGRYSFITHSFSLEKRCSTRGFVVGVFEYECSACARNHFVRLAGLFIGGRLVMDFGELVVIDRIFFAVLRKSFILFTLEFFCHACEITLLSHSHHSEIIRNRVINPHPYLPQVTNFPSQQTSSRSCPPRTHQPADYTAPLVSSSTYSLTCSVRSAI